MRHARSGSLVILLLLQMMVAGVAVPVHAETPRYPAAYSQRFVSTSPRSLPAPEGFKAVEMQPPQDKLAGDEYWSAAFCRRGVWGEVYALAQEQGQLVIAGRFSYAGPTSARNIARWDGTSWQPYGDGVGVAPGDWGTVSAVVEYGGRLIVGGDFRRAGQDTVAGVNAAYWDGTIWHAMDQGDLTGWIYDFEVFQGELYTGGSFWDAAGRQGVLRWDGSRWQSVGAPFSDGWDLIIHNDKLLVATADLWEWDGSSWSAPYGEPTGGSLICLAEWNGGIAAGGDVNGIRYNGQWVGAHGVVYWDGAGWQALGGGLYGCYDSYGVDQAMVYTLAAHNGVLCAGGRFEYTSVAGQDVWAPYAAAWAGDRWTGLGGGATNRINAMVDFGSDLVVGGLMGYVGNVSIPEHSGDVDVWGIGTWDGSSWHAFGPSGLGLNNMVHSLRIYDDRLIAAGPFTRAGEASVKGIAQFDGTTWSGLGEGLEYSVYYDPDAQSMVEFEGDLIVGGKIAKAGGIPVQNVARWDGQQWSAMGAGIPVPLTTNDLPIGLGVHEGVLFAERYRWTGTDWIEAFPVDGTVGCYCDWNGLLIIGGAFHNIGSLAVNHIVAWDGTNFLPLGEGAPGSVSALMVQGNDLVASGHYNITSMNPGFVIRWDGSTWQSLGYRTNGWAVCLANTGDHVFTGGYFPSVSNAPGQTTSATHIAQWDGSVWAAMGSGCGGGSVYRECVFGLVLFQGYLYAAGDFGFAGNRPSWFIGRWRDPAVPVYMRYFSAQRSGRTVVLRCELGEASPDRLEIWRASPGEARVLLGVIGNAGSTSLSFTDRTPPVGEADYWLRAGNAAGTGTWLGSAHVAAVEIPVLLTLAPCVPNPFNPQTAIRFSLPRDAPVKVAIYDQLGRLIRCLVDGPMTAGERSEIWDGRDGQGRPAPSGSYIVRLVTELGVRSRKLTLAR